MQDENTASKGAIRDDSDGRGETSISRREVLAGGVTAGALAGYAVDWDVLVEEATASSSTDSLSAHDHSSGIDGGPTLKPDDIATKNTPVVDVRAYGVVGDGETDDGAALQRAVDAATPRGVLYIPPEVDLYFNQPIDVNLEQISPTPGENAPPFAFVCDGTLRPAPGLAEGILIHDGLFPYVSVRVDGGGSLGDVAIDITDTYGGYFEGFASNYGGTVYRLRRIEALIGLMWSIGHLQTEGCGQALALDNVAGMGELEYVHDVDSVHLPTLRATDLSINYCKCIADPVRTTQGMLIAGGPSVWVDTLVIEGTREITNLTLEDNFMYFNRLETTGGATGVRISDLGWASFSQLRAYDNLIGVDYVEGDHNRLRVDARNNELQGLIVRESVTGDVHEFSGTIVDNGEPAEINAVEDVRILLTDVTIDENGESSDLEASATPELVVPADNRIRIYDSYVPRIDGEPKIVERLGKESGGVDRDTPDPDDWRVGDVVQFSDTSDPTNTGLYVLGPNDTWGRIDGT